MHSDDCPHLSYSSPTCINRISSRQVPVFCFVLCFTVFREGCVTRGWDYALELSRLPLLAAQLGTVTSPSVASLSNSQGGGGGVRHYFKYFPCLL